MSICNRVKSSLKEYKPDPETREAIQKSIEFTQLMESYGLLRPNQQLPVSPLEGGLSQLKLYASYALK
jgi:hypothetical protein